MENNELKGIELFFPYYINQGRLLDIYAILDGGYSEYAEITTAVNTQKTKGGKAEGTISGGFKLFNFGSTFTGEIEKSDSRTNESKEKKYKP